MQPSADKEGAGTGGWPNSVFVSQRAGRLFFRPGTKALRGGAVRLRRSAAAADVVRAAQPSE